MSWLHSAKQSERLQGERSASSERRFARAGGASVICRVSGLLFLTLLLLFSTHSIANAACAGFEEIPLLGTEVQEAALPKSGVNIVWVEPEEEPRGILALFHGGGQSACMLFDRNIELQDLVTQALDRGLLVGGWSSADQGFSCQGGDWSPVVGGPDFVNGELGLRFLLKRAGKAPGEIPIFFVGGSRGGAMASGLPVHLDVVAPVLLPTAVGLFISAAAGYDDEAYEGDLAYPPTLFIAGEEDPLNSPTEVMESAFILEGAGTPGGVIVNTRDFVRAGELSRIPGISCADARLLAQRFEDDGLTDAEGRLLHDPSDPMGMWQASIASLPAAVGDAVSYKLGEYWAGHAVTGEFSEALLDFFVVQSR